MANRPTRVRYSGVGAFVDDVQANRIQAFGSSSRLTTEDMKELGTLNIVEIVDDVPQVDVSIDQNENGTLDLFALLANKPYGCQVVAVPDGSAIGTNQVKVLAGVYKTASGHPIFFEGATIAVPTGNSQTVYLKPEVTGGGTAKVGVGTSLPTGGIALATVAGSNVIKQADIVDTRPFGEVSHLDFELANVDIFVPVKQSGSGDDVKRTMYMEKAFVNNVDYNFQTQGTVTASYRLETDNKRWFLNDGAQVIVDNIKATAGLTASLTATPNQLANGYYMLKLYKNGNPLEEGTDFTVANKVVTFTTALVAGDLIKARYTAATGGAFFSPVPIAETPHPELAGGLKEGQVEIFLSDKANSRVARIQSARISLPLTREQLKELGSLRPYDRPMQLPVNTSITLEFKDSDLEMMARFAGKDPATVREIAIEDLVKDMGLTIKLYRENDVARAKLPAGHPSKFAIKTFTVQNLIPQNENWDARVDSDATQTFEFMAHNLTVSDKIS
ncbi:hypothetical protein [Paenibacillus xylanexedens]|uniref:hypothetical protein n=1 Tax=Paenibacillus xylanexedens TaxID=528191 RepID=UPI000F540B74|nr:hypothetical protein [Paenibacillus xylanexedens]RPK20066.1 hypothetical protein EDO6_06583 [Paenibacillus xylanexedens]